MTAPTVPPDTAEVNDGDPAGTPRREPRRLQQDVRALLARRPRALNAGPFLLGLAAAAWALAIGLTLTVVPMLVAWIASPATGLTWQEAVRIAGTIWSVGQTAPVTIAGVTYSLTPWGIAIVCVLLVAHGGRWGLRRCDSGRATAVMIGTAVGAYGVAAAVIGSLAGNALAEVSPLSAGLRGLGVAGVGMLVAFLRERGPAGLPVPMWLAVALRGGLAAVGVVVAVAATLAAIVLAMRLDDAATMLTDLHAGVGGGLVVLVLGLGYVPVLVTWAIAYVLGAGVVLGPAVTVSPFVGVTAPTLLPPFPLLAAVPASASPLAWCLPATGVLAGVVAGVVIVRHARREPRLVRAGIAALGALVAALVLAGAAWLSSGSLGDLRLAHVGASPFAVALLAFVGVALGAVAVAAVPGEPGQARRRRLRVAPTVDDAADPAQSASLAPTDEAPSAVPADADPTG